MNDEASEALQLMKQEAALLRERAKVRPCVSESPEGLRKAQKGSERLRKAHIRVVLADGWLR